MSLPTHVPRHAVGVARPVAPRPIAPPPPVRRQPFTATPKRRRGRAWLPGLLLVSPSLILIGVFVYGFLGHANRIESRVDHGHATVGRTTIAVPELPTTTATGTAYIRPHGIIMVTCGTLAGRRR